jgi:hypothetical protein
MGPTTAELHRDALMSLGHSIAAGLAEGLQNPRPLTMHETAHVMEYSGRVARRAFPSLYDD